VVGPETKSTEHDDPYLDEQSSQRNIKPQQIPRVGGDDLDVLPADILRRGAHGRLHRLARRVHQELRKPFEDLLNLLRVRALQILGRELHADVTDTSCDFMIWLPSDVSTPRDQWGKVKGAFSPVA
jgi:hypothetical protein